MPNTYKELDTKSLNGISSITFTSIPQTYTDLVLVIKGVSSANQPANFRVGNGSVDTGSNYSRTGLSGNGSTATSYRGSSEVYFYTDNASGANGDAVSTTYFMNYSNTSTNKTFLNRNGATSNNVRAIVGLWRSTVAINTISADFGATLTGGTASLYGIANADLGAAKATGGIITEDSQYWYHTFGASGAFIPKQSLTCDVLVVAGGGSGAGRHGGGGGGGGLLVHTSQSVTAISYNVTVGAGGTATGTSGRGGSGVNSQFGALTASVGGGAGGSGGGSNSSLTGGSGGAGGASAVSEGGTGSAGTSGQGFAGGNGSGFLGTSYYAGGGGGGAGGAGQSLTDTANSPGGFGGVGATSSFIQSIGLASGMGQNVSGTYYFAGGGGGGNWANSTGIQGVGGFGGGGNGGKADPSNAVSGIANTGGGGGGGGLTSGAGTGVGGNGGSGIVIVRYAK
jgi:hypothetical protein